MNINLGRRRAWVLPVGGSVLVLAAATPACELVVGSDNFKVGSGSSSFTSTGGTSTSTGASTSTSSSSAAGDAGSADATTPPPRDDAGKRDDASAIEAGTIFGDSGGTNVCVAALGDGICAECWKASCCSQYSACLADPNCVALADCVVRCTTPPCGCTSTSGAMALYGRLASCGVNASAADPDGGSACANCEAVGPTDLCQWSYNCIGGSVSCYTDPFCSSGASCPGWCSPSSCAVNSDCTGNYAGGANQVGQQGVCIQYDATNGYTQCFSECNPSSTNSCSGYPGTTCLSDVDISGAAVNACE